MRSLAIVYNIYGFYHITRHEGYIGLRKNRVQLNNKKSCNSAGNRLVAGINDIIHRWTINTVIFPKACYAVGIPLHYG